MNHRYGENDSTQYPEFLSGGFIEAMWETLIALTIAAAICVGLISLSAHLDKAKTLREIGVGKLSSAAGIDASKAASHFN
jgi:hypothetical protein